MTTDLVDVEDEVLKVINPTPAQLRILSRFYEVIKGHLIRCIDEMGLDAIVEPEGSFAKGTLLSDKWELDIFILFKNVDEKWILERSEHLLVHCLKDLPYTIRYAQHPYATIHLMGMQADVVPARYLERPIGKLGVERTPFHTRYVLEKLRKRPDLANDVRLLKSFLKGIGAYGAETSIGGFSGYLAELLVINYGSFRDVLKAVSSWRPSVYVDPEGKGDENKLRRKYRDSVLIVVDPVDPERNVAAAVTLEKFSTFIVAARSYLRRPCKRFFHVFSKLKDNEIPKVMSDVEGRTIAIYMEGNYETIPRDALLGKLKRIAERLVIALRQRDFLVVRHNFYTDENEKAVIFIEVLNMDVPKMEIIEGPYAWSKEDRVIKFILKRIKEGGWVWVDKSGVLYGVRERKYVHAIEVIRNTLQEIQLPKGTKLINVISAEVTRGWVRKRLENFITDLPAWILCLSGIPR